MYQRIVRIAVIAASLLFFGAAGFAAEANEVAAGAATRHEKTEQHPKLLEHDGLTGTMCFLQLCVCVPEREGDPSSELGGWLWCERKNQDGDCVSVNMNQQCTPPVLPPPPQCCEDGCVVCEDPGPDPLDPDKLCFIECLDSCPTGKVEIWEVCADRCNQACLDQTSTRTR